MTTVVLISLICSTAALAAKPAGLNQSRQRVIRLLDRGLAQTPMRGTGRELEASGHKWNVHPAFIVGVAKVESTYGEQACSSNRYNAFGLGSCTSGWVPTFSSWAGAYDFFARWFRGRWPTARSPYDVHGYCVDRHGRDCPNWPAWVAATMNRFGFPSTVTYP